MWRASDLSKEAELLYSDKPLTPMLKKDDQFVEVSWPEALGMEGVLNKLDELKK